MNIKPGTRVRLVPNDIYTGFREGEYVSPASKYHAIRWDSFKGDLLHTEDEFEVI